MSDLKTLKLNVVKKNRVYFKCFTENGYEVKLRITPASADLELGTHELLLIDESVRTKYGTDVIYSLEAKIEKEAGVVTLQHRYNRVLVEKCQLLGGRWDADDKIWVFAKVVEDKVEDLDFLYNVDLINIEITARIARYCQPSIDFMGYPLVKAFGRDSGAQMCDDVALIYGSICSGGSAKNWTANCSEGAKFRLSVSRNIAEKYMTSYGTTEDRYWDVVILEK